MCNSQSFYVIDIWHVTQEYTQNAFFVFSYCNSGYANAALCHVTSRPTLSVLIFRRVRKIAKKSIFLNLLHVFLPTVFLSVRPFA